MEHHKLMMINRFLENPFLVLFLLILALNYSYFFVPNLPKEALFQFAKIPLTLYSFFIFPLKIPTESRRKYEISDEKFAREAAGEPISEGKNLREARRKYDGKSIRKASDELISEGKISREFRQEYEISDRKSAGKASDQPISVGKIPRNVSRKSVEKALDEPNSDRSTSIYARYEVEEIIKQPYLATSFKDFWGRRWNRYSSKMLRLTIYEPTHEALQNLSILGENTAKILAIVSTFVVSAIMHELMFYYITCGLCLKPTCEVMWFFVLQGFCISCETVFQAQNWVFMDSRVSILLKRIFIVFSFYFLLVLPVMREGKDTCEITKELV